MLPIHSVVAICQARIYREREREKRNWQM